MLPTTLHSSDNSTDTNGEDIITVRTSQCGMVHVCVHTVMHHWYGDVLHATILTQLGGAMHTCSIHAYVTLHNCGRSATFALCAVGSATFTLCITEHDRCSFTIIHCDDCMIPITICNAMHCLTSICVTHTQMLSNVQRHGRRAYVGLVPKLLQCSVICT